MGQKTGTIHIKWVRSGIALPRQQKVMVASLGLRRLNQVVERPDTPNVRGVVAKVPHLLQVVPAPVAPAWTAMPEYVITAPAALPKPPKARAEAVAKEASEEKAVQAPPAEAKAATAADSAPRKKAEGAKKGASATPKRAGAKSEGEKPRKRKAAEDKESKSAKKGKK
ncbi:MAG TPA: 50S ribosomal protein L30 [Terriglobia bacterium]|nr:50S ribosomal protein L30 [Terriglobia bacterium]